MIQWCAFCQSFIGEKPPFNDFTFTHGVCSTCNQNKDKLMDSKNLEASRKLKDKFTQLRDSIKDNNFSKLNKLLDELLATKISPIDLTMAFFQPLLFQVGEQWESGHTSVSQEHRFTSHFESFLQQLWLSRPEILEMRYSDSPIGYFCNAIGSHHNFGLQVVEFVLSLLGIPNFVEPNANDLDAIYTQIVRLKPKIVGISISLKPQVAFAEALFIKVKNDFPNISLVAGGSYFRGDTTEVTPSGYLIIRDLSALKDVFG